MKTPPWLSRHAVRQAAACRSQETYMSSPSHRAQNSRQTRALKAGARRVNGRRRCFPKRNTKRWQDRQRGQPRELLAPSSFLAADVHHLLLGVAMTASRKILGLVTMGISPLQMCSRRHHNACTYMRMHGQRCTDNKSHQRKVIISAAALGEGTPTDNKP